MLQARQKELARRGPDEYRIIARLPSGSRMVIPIGRFTYRFAKPA
jgi:hypothetical protein